MNQDYSIIMLHVYQKWSCVSCVESRWCTEAYCILCCSQGQSFCLLETEQRCSSQCRPCIIKLQPVTVSYMQFKAMHFKYILLFGAAVWLTATSINGVTGFSGWSVPGIRVKFTEPLLSMLQILYVYSLLLWSVCAVRCLFFGTLRYTLDTHGSKVCLHYSRISWKVWPDFQFSYKQTTHTHKYSSIMQLAVV